MTKPKEFQELVDAAITLEDDYKVLQEERRKKARIEPRKVQVQKSPPNLRFKPRPKMDIRKPMAQNPTPLNQVICHKCGLRGRLQKDCPQPKVICYGCGQPGRMKPNCPNP